MVGLPDPRQDFSGSLDSSGSLGRVACVQWARLALAKGPASVFSMEISPPFFQDCPQKNRLRLASSTNQQLRRLPLKSSKCPFVLSRQAQSQGPQSAALAPSVGPGEFWRPDLSLQRKSFTHCAQCSVAFLITFILYSELSQSARGA